jgi:hypothetical protein
MRRALVALPYEQTHDLVSEWFDSPQVLRRRAAAGVVAEHGVADDVPRIREHLSKEPHDGLSGDLYFICELATALARHREQGPYEELTPVLAEMPYSHGRRYIAEAMAATDSGFPFGHAIDCLWDCEAETREIGASHVERANDAAGHSLAEIIADSFEDPEVQHAASGAAQPARPATRGVCRAYAAPRR